MWCKPWWQVPTSSQPQGRAAKSAVLREETGDAGIQRAGITELDAKPMSTYESRPRFLKHPGKRGQEMQGFLQKQRQQKPPRNAACHPSVWLFRLEACINHESSEQLEFRMLFE